VMGPGFGVCVDGHGASPELLGANSREIYGCCACHAWSGVVSWEEEGRVGRELGSWGLVGGWLGRLEEEEWEIGKRKGKGDDGTRRLSRVAIE
jgi:hypothetical protein